MLKRISTFVTVVLVFSVLSLWRPASTLAQEISLIRDAEIEGTIRAFAAPLFLAAGLEPSAIKVFLVKDSTLNAFVAGGQNLFINTGLLVRSEHAGQVIGVIAHETGHIEGGHLIRTHDAMRESSAQAILAAVLGTAVAIGTGRPDVGQAIILGGQQIGMRSFLTYNRTQESAADQAAARLLERTGQSVRGLLEFLEILGDQDLLSAAFQDPYVRTHPLTQDRISALQFYLEGSSNADQEASPENQERHRRMVAKLLAFLEPLSRTLRRYPETDHSLEARYARAIAYYRKSDLVRALPLIDGLIGERPQDPYFHELKGQMLYENARVADALEPYEMAVRLAPDSGLLRIGLAQVQLESGDETLLKAAITNLRAAVHTDSKRPFTWHLLAIGYGRDGQMGMSALALAEEAMVGGKNDDARLQAERASKLLARGSVGWLQAQDILMAVKKTE